MSFWCSNAVLSPLQMVVSASSECPPWESVIPRLQLLRAITDSDFGFTSSGTVKVAGFTSPPFRDRCRLHRGI